MEKYAVEIDPKKVGAVKVASPGATVDDPTRNIPLDPEEGSKPFEKEIEEDHGKE